MSPYYEKIRKLFPTYYDNVLEIDELCKCYAWLLDVLVKCVNQYTANIFLTKDASIDYIEEFEKFLEIIPKDSYTKEDRIAYIKSKLSDRVPYDIVRLKQIIAGILENDYFKVIEHYADQYITVGLDAEKITDFSKVKVVNDVIKYIVPAHIGYFVTLLLEIFAYTVSYYGAAPSVATIYNNYATYEPLSEPNTWGDINTLYGTWGDVYGAGKWSNIYFK